MTTFPGSPENQKRAIVGLDSINPSASMIVFLKTGTVGATKVSVN